MDSPPSIEIDEQLRVAIADARAAWPEFHVGDDAILAQLSRALAKGPATTVGEWLAKGTMRDLYLACACAAGDRAALAIFETRYMAGIDAALRRLAIEPPVIAEAKQNVRVAILIGEDGRAPRIGEFSGAGNLNGWLRVIAINAARRILRRRDQTAPLEDVEFEALGDDRAHRELDFLKAKYREQFRLAFAAALAKLTPRERTLLRQHYMLGLTIDQLATIYGAHRATCARWLEKCREAVYAQTRAALVRALDVDRAEFDHIMRLIESQFDVSVRRYLEPDESEP